jgi:hypothetical protein
MEESWRVGAKRPLVMASLVITAYLAVEITGALVSGSLALLADAAHTGADVGALGLALMAAWAAGKPHTARRSFGYMRAEVLSALVNGTALLVIAVFIFIEAVQRINAPPGSPRWRGVNGRVRGTRCQLGRCLDTDAVVQPQHQRSWCVVPRAWGRYWVGRRDSGRPTGASLQVAVG